MTSTVEMITDPVAAPRWWAGLGIGAWRIATGRGHTPLDRRRPQLRFVVWAVGGPVAAAAAAGGSLGVSW